MASSISDKITEITGAEYISKQFVYNDIKRVRFEADAEYSAIVDAAAAINAEISDRLVVWGCGISDDGCPQVAIQRFEAVDPSDVSGVDTFESSRGSSGGAAVKRAFSIDTDGN